MSILETNSIGKYNGNNVSIDDPLKLKGYTTTQRDALSGVEAGDTIYNSTTGTIDYYNGTAWYSSSGNTFVFDCSYLVIAGGGSGARAGNSSGSGGGGAGGYRNSYGTEASGDGSSTETPLVVTYGQSLTVTVGAGGAAKSSGDGNQGNDSVFGTITSYKGGPGGGSSNAPTGTWGSGGGAAAYTNNGTLVIM